MNELEHFQKAQKIKIALAEAGFESKGMSVSYYSCIIFLRCKASVDIYKRGNLVLSFVKDGVDCVQCFKPSDLGGLIEKLKSNFPKCETKQ